jgi:hypothetical protein
MMVMISLSRSIKFFSTYIKTHWLEKMLLY